MHLSHFFPKNIGKKTRVARGRAKLVELTSGELDMKIYGKITPVVVCHGGTDVRGFYKRTIAGMLHTSPPWGNRASIY